MTMSVSKASVDLEAWFDRRVSEELLDALLDRNGIGILLDHRDANPLRFDVLLRRNRKTRVSTASLYVGLTKIIDVHEKGGLFWLGARPAYCSLPEFDPGWTSPSNPQAPSKNLQGISHYLDVADRLVAARYLDTEGVVQGLLCSGNSTAFTVISREAAPAFRDKSTKARWTEEVGSPLKRFIEGAGRSDRWWPSIRNHGKLPPFGSEVDILSVSNDGDLYAIEVKPPSTSQGLTWGSAQARFYAEMFARVIERDTDAVSNLSGMLAQRRSLKLSPSNGMELKSQPSVIPVLAIGSGRVHPKIRNRIVAVARALLAGGQLNPMVGEPQIWQLTSKGDTERVWRGEDLESFVEESGA